MIVECNVNLDAVWMSEAAKVMLTDCWVPAFLSHHSDVVLPPVLGFIERPCWRVIFNGPAGTAALILLSWRHHAMWWIKHEACSHCDSVRFRSWIFRWIIHFPVLAHRCCPKEVPHHSVHSTPPTVPSPRPRSRTCHERNRDLLSRTWTSGPNWSHSWCLWLMRIGRLTPPCWISEWRLIYDPISYQVVPFSVYPPLATSTCEWWLTTSALGRRPSTGTGRVFRSESVVPWKSGNSRYSSDASSGWLGGPP